MRKQCVALSAIVAVLAFAGMAGSAQAQTPLDGILGTGTACTGGLISVAIGGTTVCVAPSVPGAPSTPDGVTTQTCPSGGVAVDIAGQGVVCLLSGNAIPGSTGGTPCPAGLLGIQLPNGAGLLCVVPTDVVTVPNASECRDGLIPVEILGGGIGCVTSALIGGAGANGSNGANGAPGSSGASGADGATPGGATNATSGANGTRAGSGSSTSAAARRARVLKPKLVLSKRLRGSRRGVVQSSTKKVVITTIGKRHGRTVRYTKQVSLKRTGAPTASRPYSGRVKIVLKTQGRVRIRVTSRGPGGIKTLNVARTVRR